MAEDTATRAARGATLLDRVRPGWFNAIDQIHIDMSSCTWCILGQVYGGYGNGLAAIGVGSMSACPAMSVWPDYLGFCTVVCWDALAEAWRAEIRRRMEGEKHDC